MMIKDTIGYSSNIFFFTDGFSIDRNGVVDPCEYIGITGQMGKQRIGNLLPSDYASMDVSQRQDPVGKLNNTTDTSHHLAVMTLLNSHKAILPIPPCPSRRALKSQEPSKAFFSVNRLKM